MRFFYTFCVNKWVLYIATFLINAIKTYKDIYIPTWIDQLGKEQNKSLYMLLFYNIFNSGYIFSSILLYNDSFKWYFNYIIIGIFVPIIAYLLVFFPKQNYSLNIEEDNDNKNNEKTSLFRTIITNKVYIFSVLTKMFYVFVFQVVHVYIIDYVTNCNNFEGQFRINFIELKDSILGFGTFIGIIFGGMVLSCIGGYEKEKSAIFLGTLSIILYFSILIIAFVYNSYIFYIGLFLNRYFSMPFILIINCFIVNSIQNKYKIAGIALSLIITTIFGDFIGLIFYEFLSDK